MVDVGLTASLPLRATVADPYTPRSMAASTKGSRVRKGDSPSKSGASGVEHRVESLLDELDTVVDALEEGDLPLEEALEKFERGVQLAKNSHRALDAMEQRVERLLADRDGVETEEMDAGDE